MNALAITGTIDLGFTRVITPVVTPGSTLREMSKADVYIVCAFIDMKCMCTFLPWKFAASAQMIAAACKHCCV